MNTLPVSSLPSKIFYACLALLTILVISYSFYLSITLCSYFIIGRDEANFLLRSSMEFFSAGSPWEAFQQLFQTHGQHILVGMQLANLLSFLLFGVLDFQFINVMGLLYLIIPAFLICLRIYRHCSTNGFSTNGFVLFPVIFAIVFPLALSPGHISCAINTACTGNHYLGLGLSIIALYFFVPEQSEKHPYSRIITAELFTLAAIFSSPASLALVPLFFMIILFLDRKISRLIWHTLCSMLVLYAYFHISDPADFSYISQASPLADLEFVALYFLFLFNLLGSVFFWPEHTVATLISITLGLCITFGGLWQIYTHRQLLHRNRHLLFLAGGFCLLLGMTGLIALGRLGTVGSPRYIFYACFALIFLTGFFLANHPRWFPGKASLLALLCLCYFPIQLLLNQPYLHRIRDDIATCNERWRTQGKACGVMIKHDEATALLLEAESRGILKLPRR